jgi:hypothetical protein
MKVLETDPRWPRWFNDFLNTLAVDTDRITSKAYAIGKWGLYTATTEADEWFNESGQIVHPNQYQSHVFNAWMFRRWVYVDGKLRGLTWSWRKQGKNYKHTIILGTKINGRFALTFRFNHTDEESERGTTGPNYGQAKGDEWGTA